MNSRREVTLTAEQNLALNIRFYVKAIKRDDINPTWKRSMQCNMEALLDTIIDTIPSRKEGHL